MSDNILPANYQNPYDATPMKDGYVAPGGVYAPGAGTATTLGSAGKVSGESNPATFTTGVYGSINDFNSRVYGQSPIDWNQGGRGATYRGPVARVDPTIIGTDPNNGGFNQLLLDLPQQFEKMIQSSVTAHPRWWHDRIPRGAYQLFNGTVQETRIFRGGLLKYAGLSGWSDIDPVPSATNNPCGTGDYETTKYGWEALQWSGKKAYWGSDPICLDSLKFSVRVQEQLAWIIEAGAEQGIQMQEVWNREFFIYQSVLFGRSFLMTHTFNGPDSPKYVYDPFVKFGDTAGDGVADKTVVSKPFIVFDASVDLEPLNFDVLDQVRASLQIRCPQAAVSRGGGEPIFALAVSHDDVERYIRGNEEERKYWIEANPQALISHYGFAPNTFRRWSITNDGNQMRFKLKTYISQYTAATALKYGNVGAKLFKDKPVWIAEVVDPLIESTTRVGVGGSPIPEDNPEYYKAEIAIAPIFMNQVFTNQFVPSVTTLGSGTHFGPVTGLNGKWGWVNIRDSQNPEGNVGKFFGKFEIVPKPEPHVFHVTSFLYRRCTQSLKSLCPAENLKVNVSAKNETTVSSVKTITDVSWSSDTNYTNGVYEITLVDPLPISGPGDTILVGGQRCYVLSAPATTRLLIQLPAAEGAEAPTGAAGGAKGTAVALGD